MGEHKMLSNWLGKSRHICDKSSGVEKMMRSEILLLHRINTVGIGYRGAMTLTSLVIFLITNLSSLI